MKTSLIKSLVRFGAVASLMALTVSSVHAASYGTANWNEKNGRIVHKSVCNNHVYGSIAYRNCRAQAMKHFKAQCENYTQQVNQSSGAVRKGYKKKMKKYCYSVRNFKIVD